MTGQSLFKMEYETPILSGNTLENSQNAGAQSSVLRGVTKKKSN